VRIGFFAHIPFPGYEIFAQLPWRRQIVQGLLGADLLGFQRRGDAVNFLRACRRTAGLSTSGSLVRLPAAATGVASGLAGAAGGRSANGPSAAREIRVGAFPASIDFAAFEKLAHQESVRARAQEIRESLGHPGVVLLGIDRLDYTKGIIHRLNALGELLDEGRVAPSDVALIQVASPSRERVEHYRLLRDEVEVAVGRINGEHAELGSPPIHYLHQTYPREEMAALYLAADVMLVTALRDGMNLVAKEYVACRTDDTGALVLSEFTGAADELTGAILVNPHDIEGMKDAIMLAVRISPNEARRRMRSMRRRVRENDVTHWAAAFIAALTQVSEPSISAS
jgi:trehalose-6-phosphate synthase